MFNCNDSLVDFLRKEYGYNLVRLPRETINPLQLFMKKEGNLISKIKNIFSDVEVHEINANINHLLISSTLSPPTYIDEFIPNDLVGRKSSKTTSSVASKIFRAYIDSLVESSKAEIEEFKEHLEIVLTKANDWEFKISENSIKRSINYIQLDSFLSQAKVNKGISDNFLEKLIVGDIYIITSVLKSNSFSIVNSTNTSLLNKLAIPDLQKLAKGMLELQLTSDTSSELKFKGEKSLTFGFQAAQLVFEKKFWNADQPALSLKIRDRVNIKGDDSSVNQLFISNQPFIDIE